MFAQATPSICTSASPMPVCSIYRRKTTQKAPRKRSALLLFSKFNADSVALTASGGGGGPRGPKDYSGCRGWRSDDPSSNNGQGTISSFVGSFASVIVCVTMAGYLQPGLALAAATSLFSDGFQLEVVPRELGAAADDSNTAPVSALLESYPTGVFSDEEKELACPKQYRVRDIIYVGLPTWR